jgi:hypothetical protein
MKLSHEMSGIRSLERICKWGQLIFLPSLVSWWRKEEEARRRQQSACVIYAPQLSARLCLKAYERPHLGRCLAPIAAAIWGGKNARAEEAS